MILWSSQIWTQILGLISYYSMKNLLIFFTIFVTTCCFDGHDTDGDGVDDSFTIFINEESYTANKCQNESLHASNELTDAGWIEMCNNKTHFFVSLTSKYGFQPGTDQIVAWVGTDENDLPRSEGGIKNGAFPEKSQDELTGNTWGFILKFSDFKSLDGFPVDCNAFLFVYIHANVFDLNGEAQTSYGGNICYKSSGKDDNNQIGRWYCKSEYLAQCPESIDLENDKETMQICETAFAYGTHIFASKFNPDHLSKYEFGQKTNRWGWLTLLSQECTKTEIIWSGAGRNDISKGINVGTASFSYTISGSPTVMIDITLKDGVSVNEYHAYVSDKPPTKIYAPGSYTDIQHPKMWKEQWAPIQSFTYSNGQVLKDGEIIDLVDQGNDGIWIGVHILACRTVPI